MGAAHHCRTRFCQPAPSTTYRDLIEGVDYCPMCKNLFQNCGCGLEMKEEVDSYTYLLDRISWSVEGLKANQHFSRSYNDTIRHLQIPKQRNEKHD